MLRQKIAGLLNRVRNVKRLGMYIAVVLLAFALIIPLTGRGTAPKNRALPPTGGAAEAANKTAVESGDNTAGILPAEDLPPGEASDLASPAPAGEAEAVTPSMNDEDKPASPPLFMEEGDKSAPDAPPVNDGDKAPASAPPQKNDAVNSAPDLTATVAAAADIKSIGWPLKGEILQETGIAYSKTFSDYRYHNGIDIKGERGAEVAAVLPGKVLSLETSRGEAKKVVVDHGSGHHAVYSHLEEVYVKPGMAVKAGQAIGHIGQPGLNEILEGPHLHFTLLVGDKVVNPLDYLPR